MSDLYGEQYLSEEAEDFIDSFGDMDNDGRDDNGMVLRFCPDCGLGDMYDALDSQCFCDRCERIFNN